MTKTYDELTPTQQRWVTDRAWDEVCGELFIGSYPLADTHPLYPKLVAVRNQAGDSFVRFIYLISIDDDLRNGTISAINSRIANSVFFTPDNPHTVIDVPIE